MVITEIGDEWVFFHLIGIAVYTTIQNSIKDLNVTVKNLNRFVFYLV